jgi:hypothetical protein
MEEREVREQEEKRVAEARELLAREDVREVIELRLGAGDPTPTQWIVQQIISQRQSLLSHPWVRACAVFAVTALTRSELRRLHPSAETEEQLVFPGCERMQRAYLVDRSGASMVVPTEQCTDAELRAKIDELRAMGDGCYAHATEIGRYIKKRRQAGSA